MQMVGRQHHPDNVVGRVWRIRDPQSVRVGHCFLAGRLLEGDLFLCTEHAGDWFQNYVYVKEYANKFILHPEWNFGSYGIGDAEHVKFTEEQVKTLIETKELPNDSYIFRGF